MKKETNQLRKTIDNFEHFPVAGKLKFLDDLKPFFEDSANYFGIYEDAIVKFCKVMGWKRK